MLGLFTLLSCMLCLTRSALQPEDVDSGKYDDLDENLSNSTLCTRTCRRGERPKICYYKWYLENHMTMGRQCGDCPRVKADCYKPQCVSADGFERAILSVNRRLAGPSIQVCKGDTVVVDVKNQMKGMETTIHWHGVIQRKTPWMDGIPMVTQCPIASGQTFRYKFQVEDAGTFWYHSHSGLQKDDGLLGGFVVRQPDAEEPLRKFYDYDLPSHTLVVEDWKHFTVQDILPGLLGRHILEDSTPTYYLINGKGIDPANPAPFAQQTPVSVFKVKKGKRYRFRIVGATSLACFFRFSIEGHRLLLIAIDKNPIKPVTVDTVEIASGERYDVVVETDQPIAAYQMVVRGIRTCGNSTQVAFLQYEDAKVPTKYTIKENNEGVLVNPSISECSDESLSKEICISQMSSIGRTPRKLRGEPDVRILIDFGYKFSTLHELYETNTFQNYFWPNEEFSLIFLINNISYVSPPSPLLTQLRDVPPSTFCDSCPPYKQKQGYCSCTNLIKLPLNSLVEVLMLESSLDPRNRLPHPFHIHGYDFYVVEQAPIGNSTLKDIENRLKRRRKTRDFLPLKDTVIVGRDSYTVGRIFTDNPGMWFFHCHFNFHLAYGMAAVLQVGEPRDFVPPPRNFPRCNEFVPYVEGLYD